MELFSLKEILPIAITNGSFITVSFLIIDRLLPKIGLNIIHGAKIWLATFLYLIALWLFGGYVEYWLSCILNYFFS
ncbi:Uncharacterised protein [Moraxella cuniculi]|uniref:Uncharacterized protein n=1 Tax=Moraxella cuniculi TaxID=34061 RepID=A0A3S4UTP5_9GAMM|nr:Uncharacterised protein [Moraxella cuniculi]